MNRMSFLVAVIAGFVVTSSAQAASIYEIEVLSDNPVLHFNFSDISGGGSVVEDSSPNNNDGAVGGVVAFDGESALPGDPTGASARIDAGAGSIFAVGAAGLNEAFTVEWWLKPNVGSNRNWNQQITGGGNWGRFLFHGGADGGVHTGAGNCCGTRFTSANIPAGTVEEGVWQHFAFTFDDAGGAGEAKFLKNGVVIAEKSGMDAPADGAGPWLGLDIRGAPGANALGEGIDGLIDEVSVYDKALSPERIAEHFAAASVIVPEPSGLTIGLVLAGMLAAVGRRRRRK